MRDYAIRPGDSFVLLKTGATYTVLPPDDITPLGAVAFLSNESGRRGHFHGLHEALRSGAVVLLPPPEDER